MLLRLVMAHIQHVCVLLRVQLGRVSSRATIDLRQVMDTVTRQALRVPMLWLLSLISTIFETTVLCQLQLYKKWNDSGYRTERRDNIQVENSAFSARTGYLLGRNWVGGSSLMCMSWLGLLALLLTAGELLFFIIWVVVEGLVSMRCFSGDDCWFSCIIFVEEDCAACWIYCVLLFVSIEMV